MEERANEARAACPPAAADPLPREAETASGWRHWLAGSPREVLARVVPGDPLCVRDEVARALREQAVFLDADRVHLRALALAARAAPRYAGRPELAEWVRAHALRAIEELLREDLEAPAAEPGAAFVQLARPLGLDPEALRRGCTAFNRLAHAERAAFCALVLHGRALDDVAREQGVNASEAARRARRALDSVLHASHPDVPAAAARAHTARPEEQP